MKIINTLAKIFTINSLTSNISQQKESKTKRIFNSPHLIFLIKSVLYLVFVVSFLLNYTPTNNYIFNKINNSNSKMARCFLIPNKDSFLDGHVRFFQESPESPVTFEIEVYSPTVSDVVIYNNHSIDYTCNDIGEEIFRLDLEEELRSSNYIIKKEGITDNLNLYDESIYEYSCVAHIKDEKRIKEKTLTSDGKLIGGCGRLQKYEIESSYIFGTAMSIVHLLFTISYFYFFGI